MYQVTVRKTDGNSFRTTYDQDFYALDVQKLVALLNSSYWATVEKPEEVKEGQ